MAKEKKELKLVNVLVTCPKLKKNVTIKAEQLEWKSDLADCEFCGSHGDIEVSFMCPCGQYHSLSISEW